jgi:transcriptional regulator with XRE-family HTH domain
MGFGARLAEERKRLGFRQAQFASLVGTDVPKQSLYENDRRELRAAYLSKLPAAGVDLLYVLTGRRSQGWLDEGAAEALAAWFQPPGSAGGGRSLADRPWPARPALGGRRLGPHEIGRCPGFSGGVEEIGVSTVLHP